MSSSMCWPSFAEVWWKPQVGDLCTPGWSGGMNWFYIWPFFMRSVACMTALESGQTIAGLSDSIIQWVHWSTMLQLQLLWFHKVSNVQCSCWAWPLQTILRLVWLYHWPVTGQRDTSLCRGVSEPEVFLGCDEFCNYVRGPGKFLDSLGLQLHSCLFK